MLVRIDTIPGNNISEVIRNLCSSLDPACRVKMLGCIGVILDCLWKTRNKFIHSLASIPCLDSVRKEITSRFHEMSTIGDGVPLMKSNRLSTTVFPKLYTDKCILVDESYLDGRFGCALLSLVRGSFDWWRCSSSSACESALEAEMQAMVLGLQWASLNHWDNLSLISDSKVLVEAIRLLLTRNVSSMPQLCTLNF
ncbi:hypothetical protein G4B88_001090 [Cannabis sativa]|uniref:RNase H type-1 domain-containing protein n=1 Tax=Cannabis sativa TaxID=3483 RepID=A0A7J6DLS1_CANSA|nr:hypothetical protein G4B88_001090 [Cannabis sativa]